MEARVRRASACVELALEALDGDAPRKSTSSEAAWLEQRVNGLLERLAQRVETAPEPLLEAHAEGFVGSSTVIPLPELLSFLRAQEKTGLLRVKLDAEVIHLHLRDGDLAHAFSDSAQPGRRLGDILVEQGAVDAWLLEKVLAESGREGSARARVAQLATEEQLRAARSLQVQRLFHRLFEARDALFSFQEGDQIAATEGARMDLLRLLLESARFQDERSSDQRVPPPAWSPDAIPTEGFGGWLLGDESPGKVAGNA